MASKKRTNGEGSVYLRKDGTYCAQKTIDGNRITGYGRTKSEAFQKLNQNIKRRIASGKTPPTKSGNVKIRDYIPYFLRSIPSTNQKTMATYTIVSNRLIKYVGDEKLKSIKQSMVIQLVKDMLSDGYARSTILETVMFLSRIHKKARKEGYIESEENLDLKNIPLPPKERYVLPSIETVVKELLKMRSFSVKTLALFCLYTGLRRGELIGLQWDDINLNTGIITINRSISCDPLTDESIIGAPKNNTLGQTVQIPDNALQLLSEIKRYQKERKIISPYVFCKDDGSHLRPKSVSSTLKRTMLRICPRGAVHILRHLNATLMAKNNVPIRTIALQLRHSSVSTTDKYINDIMGEERTEVKGLNIMPPTTGCSSIAVNDN